MPIVTDTIQIPFEAYDNATASINKLDAKLDAFSKKRKENHAAAMKAAKEQEQADKQQEQFNRKIIAGAVAAGAAIVKFGVDSYKTYQNYAQQVRDLSTISGTGAEETSRFLQVLDDYQISAEEATAATRFLTKQGLTPTIDTLAQLSDAYLALQDPMERNEFVLKNLGRGGMQWVNVLKQGGDALRAAGDDVNGWLLLSDEQIAKVEQQRLAMDALADSWQGLKVQAGAAIGKMILKAESAADTWEFLNKVTGKSQLALRSGLYDYSNYVAAYERGTAMTEFYTKQVEGNTEALKAQEQAIEDATEANQSFMSTLMTVQSQTESFNEKNDELRQSIYDLTKEQEKYREGSDAYNEIGAKIDEQKGKVQELAAEHEKASKKIVFSMLQQMAASDGLTDTEVSNLVTIGEEWGILDQTTARAVKSMIGEAEGFAASLDDPAFKLKNINQTLKQIENKAGSVWDFFVNIHTSGSFSVPTTMGGGGAGGEGNVPYSMQATGGYLGNGYTLTGEQGPELISPAGRVYTASQTRAILDNGMAPQYSYAAGGNIMLDGVTNITPTNAVNWGFPTINKPKGGGDESSTVAAEAAASAVAEPVIAAVQTAIEKQQIQMMTGLMQQTREAKETNQTLKAILIKIASERGIASAMIETQLKYS